MIATFSQMNQNPAHLTTGADSTTAAKPVEPFQELQRSIEALGGDPDYIALALAEFFSAMPPLGPSQLSEVQERFLVESGELTQSALEAVQHRVQRGGWAVHSARSFAQGVYSTLSLEDAAGFLDWEERHVAAAAEAGRLYSVVIAGRTRFPEWQFQLWAPDRLLPGLEAIIELAADWNWLTLAGLMSVPQGDLLTKGPQTPPDWLRLGGSLDAVTAIIASGPARTC